MIDKMYILHQRIMLMAVNKTKFTLVTFLFLSLSIGVSSCKSADAAQKSVDLSSKDQVSIMKPQTIPRKALRIKGEVTTEVVTLAKRTMFNLRIEEIVGVGFNFKGREPNIGETVSIDAPISIEVNKGEIITVDVSEMNNQVGDNLLFNLLQKIKK
jgi:hypothetical protein